MKLDKDMVEQSNTVPESIYKENLNQTFGLGLGLVNNPLFCPQFT